MNIMSTVNVNTARRPRTLPVARGIQSRVQPTVRDARPTQRGHGNPRGCLEARDSQPARALTGPRGRKPIIPPEERQAS